MSFFRSHPLHIFRVASHHSLNFPPSSLQPKVALKTALQSYAAARALVTPELEPLVSQELRAIQDSITEAFDVPSATGRLSAKRRVRWDSKDLPSWVALLNEHVSRFEERVEILLRASDKIDVAIDAIGTAVYDRVQFAEAVENVQKVVDELSLAGYSDLSSWVETVNEKMGVVLGRRLEEALVAWTETFEIAEGGGADDEANQKKKKDRKKLVKIPKISVEIMLKNQEISAQPAVPTARVLFLDALHDYVGIVCTLPCLNSGRFEVFDSSGSQGTDSFHSLIGTVSPDVLADVYVSVENHVQNLASFVDHWLSYQTLWDSQVGDVAASVEGDLKRWHELILQVSTARATLDSTDTTAEFGPIVVRFNKVQSQVNLKYDSWQKELQSYFAAVLSGRIQENYDRTVDAKSRLEKVSLEGSSAATR